MSGAIGLPPIPTFLSESANETKDAAAAAAANPQASQLIAYFQKVGPSLTTPQALLKDYKALEVVLGAFGIGSLITSPAEVQQLLTQNPSSKSSLAYQLANPKYLVFAQALSNWSTPPFQTKSAIQSIVAGYQTNIYEASANNQAPGLQNALYFNRQIGGITNLTQLQSDPTLLAVVVTGLGLPLTQFQELTFQQQTTILQNKLTISNLQKPAYTQRLAEQYLIVQQSQAQTNALTVQPGSELSLFGGADESGNSLLTILDASNTATTALSTSGTNSAGSLLSLFA